MAMTSLESDMSVVFLWPDTPITEHSAKDCKALARQERIAADFMSVVSYTREVQRSSPEGAAPFGLASCPYRYPWHMVKGMHDALEYFNVRSMEHGASAQLIEPEGWKKLLCDFETIEEEARTWYDSFREGVTDAERRCADETLQDQKKLLEKTKVTRRLAKRMREEVKRKRTN